MKKSKVTEKSEVIKLMYEGTYLGNNKEILDNLNKCNKIDFESNDANEVEVNQPLVENSALETVPETLDDIEDLLQQGSKAVKEANDPGNDGLNDKVCVEAGNAQEIMKVEMNVLQVVNLMLIAIVIAWFILTPALELVCNIMIYLLTCGVQCVFLFSMFAMLDMFLEYDTESLEKVPEEVNDDKEVEKYTMTELKVRLKVVGDHGTLQLEVGVHHNVPARMTKGGKNCCCHSCCVLSEHRKTDGIPNKNVELSKEFKFPVMLDRALDKFEDFKVDMLDGMHVVQDKPVSLLRAINTDLGQAELDDEEEDQLLFSASANTTDTMSST